MGIERGGAEHTQGHELRAQAEMRKFLLEAEPTGKKAFADQIGLVSSQGDIAKERDQAQKILDQRERDPRYEAAFLQVKTLRNELTGELGQSHRLDKTYDVMQLATEVSTIMEAMLQKKPDERKDT